MGGYTIGYSSPELIRNFVTDPTGEIEGIIDPWKSDVYSWEFYA